MTSSVELLKKKPTTTTIAFCASGNLFEKHIIGENAEWTCVSSVVDDKSQQPSSWPCKKSTRENSVIWYGTLCGDKYSRVEVGAVNHPEKLLSTCK
jgi:hypothetical protein